MGFGRCDTITGMSNLWALIDANNFFVSCERVFRPDLSEKPVLVLSCNDGCVVSRSAEVKALGIPMGAPRFQIEAEIKRNGIECFSSNFRLYADLSSRMMRLIGEVVGSENQEIYSIDECFVRLPLDRECDWQAWGERLRGQILQSLGIPVTVGVATSKTLAKLATEIAKKDVFGKGAMAWMPGNIEWQERYLRPAPIMTVWGLGQATVHKLLAKRVATVGDFLAWESKRVRQYLGLNGEKTWRELQGESCIELKEAKPAHRQIGRSRSFGEAVYTREELAYAVSEYLSAAAGALRRHGWRASMVTVRIRSGRYVPREQFYAAAWSVGLEESTSFLPDLASAAMKALAQIYRPGVAYKKAGVILSEIESEAAWQPQLLEPDKPGPEEEQKQKVSAAVEQINQQWGGWGVTLGWAGGGKNAGGKAVWQKWRSRATRRSPQYTSRWEELRRVQ